MNLPPEARSPYPMALVAANPLFGNPLVTREDLARACRDIYAPLAGRYAAKSSRVWLGAQGASYTPTSAAIEGFIRPFWGLFPLWASGGPKDGLDRLVEGIAAGVDPDGAHYWGAPVDRDQRLVEFAAYGFGLALVPDLVWGGLSATSREQLARWLDHINRLETADNNWLFFRVLVNLGLERVGWADRRAETEATLARLDSFYRGEGWYTDGSFRRIDYYVPFALHFYALIYAGLAAGKDPGRAARYREQARRFAMDYRHWFDAEGASVPMGRSLYYRFAHSAFWPALAFSGAEAPEGMNWGEIRGLYLRNLRWWSQRPITDRDGILTVGYATPNHLISEQYNSPCGPYWATKAFLALAIPDSHPFWSEPEVAKCVSPGPSVQVSAAMVLYDGGGHQVALNAGQEATSFRQAAAKYAKFAYSSRFGFSVESDTRSLEAGCYDSMLALSDDDGRHYRVREDTIEQGIENGAAWSRWQPFADVTVTTWLIAAPPWHIRIHHIDSRRPLRLAEGGFAIDRTGDDPNWHSLSFEEEPRHCLMRAPAGASGIRCLAGGRGGQAVIAYPNTNVVAPRTAIPMLIGAAQPGRTVLACAVLAGGPDQAFDTDWPTVPDMPDWAMDLLR